MGSACNRLWSAWRRTFLMKLCNVPPWFAAISLFCAHFVRSGNIHFRKVYRLSCCSNLRNKGCKTNARRQVGLRYKLLAHSRPLLWLNSIHLDFHKTLKSTSIVLLDGDVFITNLVESHQKKGATKRRWCLFNISIFICAALLIAIVGLRYIFWYSRKYLELDINRLATSCSCNYSIKQQK